MEPRNRRPTLSWKRCWLDRRKRTAVKVGAGHQALPLTIDPSSIRF